MLLAADCKPEQDKLVDSGQGYNTSMSDSKLAHTKGQLQQFFGTVATLAKY